MSQRRGGRSAAAETLGLGVALVLGAALLAGGCGGRARTAAPTAQPLENGPAGDPGWRPRVPLRDWQVIVVHHAAMDSGSAAAIDRIHRAQNWENGLGYDFVIGNGTESGDGEIEVGPRWQRQIEGAHCRVSETNNYYNEQGIGVCLVGNFNDCRPSGKQLASLTRLVRWLQAEYQVPRSKIYRHKDLKPTDCPGDLFPWDEFLAGTFAAPPERYASAGAPCAAPAPRRPRVPSAGGNGGNGGRKPAAVSRPVSLSPSGCGLGYRPRK